MTRLVKWVPAAVPGLLLMAGFTPALADDTHTIEQKNRAFHPAEVTVSPGTALVFTNADAFIHQIYVDGLFDSDEKGPGENLTESFPARGTFEVRCHVHPKMRLIVHVR